MRSPGVREAIRRLVEIGLEGEREVIAFFRAVLYRCCMAIAFICGLAALTIAVAIVANKLPDSQAWMAVVFFMAVGAAALIVGRAAST